MAELSIANPGTANATLMYAGRPMLKVGPMPEVAVFAVELGSASFNVEEWLDWMAQHQMGYGRVYAESGYDPWQAHDSDKRIYPFDVVRWEQGHPVVDLTRFNQAYWDNFRRVISACAERGIVLHMQLYQRVFFALNERTDFWLKNYFHPQNNINGFPETRLPNGQKSRNGYWLWHAMATQPEWRKVHRHWVEQILDAIGDNGNVLIDLLNEANFKHNHMTKAWIEYTLDIIEAWEERTDNDILVGMDFDHWYKRKDTGIDYILSHPRMELIICEGSEGHVNRALTAGSRKAIQEDLAVLYRERYGKPIVSANSPSYWPDERLEDGTQPQFSNSRVRQYQWESMMLKVQGVGVYAKTYPLDFASPVVKRYAAETEGLMDFFKDLRDYISLEMSPEIITQAPGRQQRALQSAQEVLVYLHTDGFGKTNDGGLLKLENLKLMSGPVAVETVHPYTGKHVKRQADVQDRALPLELPAFYEDIAIHILSCPPADYGKPSVRILKNLPYLGLNREEALDLYLPDDTNTARPAIVIIHGGGWYKGDKGGSRERNIGMNLAAAGYVCASINYSLAKTGSQTIERLYHSWPQNLHDCKSAVRFLRLNAGKYGINAERIGAIGGSAGGHLAALLAVTDAEHGLDPEGPYGELSCRIQAVVPMYGVHDILEQARFVTNAGLSEGQQQWLRGVSPISYVSGDDPPALILHGTADALVPVAQSQILHQRLRDAKVHTELRVIEGAPHSFDLQPEQADLRPLVIDFFDRHLKD
jgi:acetyl esterase/lipase